MIGKDDTRLCFERNWSKFKKGILQYGENSRKKGIKSMMEAVVETGT